MPKTLLLADDSVTIQKVVGISFANEDIVLLTVDNGDDAIARAREARPDIVLADVVMPGMNGYEVCEAIKSDPQLRHIPVLLLTGTFEAFDEERATRAGADGHITKPFEAQALVDQVNARLAQAAASAPAPEPAPASESPAPPHREEPSFADTLGLHGAPNVSPGAGESFDFFDEEITEPRNTDARPAAETVVVDDELEVASEPEDAFAFEAPDELDNQMSDSSASGAAWADTSAPAGMEEEPVELDTAPDRTVAMLHESDGFETAPTQPPEARAILGEADLTQMDAPETPGLGDPLEDLSTSLPEEPVPTRIMKETGTPEPAPEPPSAPPPGAADETRILSELDTDPLSIPEGEDLLDDDERVPGESPVAAPLDAQVEPDDLAAEAVLDPEGGRDFDVSSSDLGDPLRGTPSAPGGMDAEVSPPWSPGAPAPAEEEALAEAVPEAEFGAPSDSPAAPAREAPAPSAGGAPDLSPIRRQQLHDALERIAWEAFSDVAEQIVKDALSRIERVAWEVIPQMAEALIREEIQKLKGEDD